VLVSRLAHQILTRWEFGLRLPVFFKDEPGTLVFPGMMGGPLRRGNSNRMSAWHFHALRHTGNHFAASRGAGLRDLMARDGG
jgi:hypothetical protein